MKKMMKIIIFGLVAMTLSSLTVWAEEDSSVSASADVSVLSRYMWRGYVFSEDSLVVQPSITASYKNFSINIWGNLDTDQSDNNYLTEDDSNFNETDLTLSYAIEFDKLCIDLGYIYYGLEGAEDTQELYYSVSYDCLLAPTLAIYFDFDSVPGIYVNLGVSHSIDLGNDVSLDLSASVGYYDSDDLHDFGVDSNGAYFESTDSYSALHDGNISASITVPVGKYLSITPSLSYAFPLSNKAEKHLKGTNGGNFSVYDGDLLYGGVTCSVAF